MQKSTKPKRKKKQTQKNAKQKSQPTSNIDDIDAALKDLSTRGPQSGKRTTSESVASSPKDDALLAVDLHHLQVANELRRVFGRAAFTADKEEREDRRNHQLDGNGVGLADAVTGRFAAGGPGLPQLLRRRNIFVQGEEEWPRNTSNGLTMEVESRRPDGITLYRFKHLQQYTMSQMAFAQCVTTMDPTNMVNMLRFYPYHVATLLQVSEISKQERDPATAGELLSRALFAFGKALHPTFASAIQQGKARLDFRRPENREFFLAASRYIGNIGMRATWRTAYEWAKLLLQLDPDNDPYCVSLMIDQLALRARQPQSLLELANSHRFAERWKELVNIRYSTSLATHYLKQSSSESTRMLQEAAERYPWVAARLYQHLDIAKVPPAVWGKGALTEKDALHSELYATLGQDLWKLPDATAFLTQTLSGLDADKTKGSHQNTEQITVNEARYVILADKPALIGYLPRELTSNIESMSDPLPPEDSISDYDIAELGGTQREAPRSMIRDHPRQFISELLSLQRFFESVWPSIVQGGRQGGQAGPDTSEFSIERAANEANVGVAEIRQRMRRILEMRDVLAAQPDARVSAGDADLRMGQDGNAIYRGPELGADDALFGLDPQNAQRVEAEIEEELQALQREEANNTAH